TEPETKPSESTVQSYTSSSSMTGIASESTVSSSTASSTSSARITPSDSSTTTKIYSAYTTPYSQESDYTESDNRTSAKAFGTLALIVLITLIGLIVLSDIITTRRHIKQLKCKDSIVNCKNLTLKEICQSCWCTPEPRVKWKSKKRGPKLSFVLSKYKKHLEKSNSHTGDGLSCDQLLIIVVTVFYKELKMLCCRSRRVKPTVTHTDDNIESTTEEIGNMRAAQYRINDEDEKQITTSCSYRNEMNFILDDNSPIEDELFDQVIIHPNRNESSSNGEHVSEHDFTVDMRPRECHIKIEGGITFKHQKPTIREIIRRNPFKQIKNLMSSIKPLYGESDF
ncbi:unnamed protein product, partial [Owenia fusiformis]